MNFISFFAGIDGFALGFERVGMVCVAQVEIDPFCRKILSKHWPNVPKFGDIKNVGRHNLPSAQLFCGGFPCQDVSEAGAQAGIKEDTRSGLFFEFIRIVREVRPRWVVIENVRGLLSSNNGSDFRTVLWELHRSGYDAEWQTLRASCLGFPHQRKRVFILAYPTSQRRYLLHNQATTVLNWDSLSHQVKSGYTWKRQNGGHSLERVGWDVAPAVCRSYDGIPAELDEAKARLKALGNAVVPQEAELIGRAIMAVEAQHRSDWTG